MLQNCLLTYVPTNRGSSIVFSDNFKASDGVGDTLSPIQAFVGTFLTHIQHLTNDVSPKLKMVFFWWLTCVETTIAIAAAAAEEDVEISFWLPVFGTVVSSVCGVVWWWSEKSCLELDSLLCQVYGRMNLPVCPSACLYVWIFPKSLDYIIFFAHDCLYFQHHSFLNVLLIVVCPGYSNDDFPLVDFTPPYWY